MKIYKKTHRQKKAAQSHLKKLEARPNAIIQVKKVKNGTQLIYHWDTSKVKKHSQTEIIKSYHKSMKR